MAKSAASKTAATASTNGKAIGLNSFIGQRVTLFCVNYFYTGTLADVLDDCVHLTEPSIVYETGAWSSKSWSDAQALPGAIFVMRASIESFGAMK